MRDCGITETQSSDHNAGGQVKDSYLSFFDIATGQQLSQGES
jgi:hypothetical protein